MPYGHLCCRAVLMGFRRPRRGYSHHLEPAHPSCGRREPVKFQRVRYSWTLCHASDVGPYTLHSFTSSIRSCLLCLQSSFIDGTLPRTHFLPCSVASCAVSVSPVMTTVLAAVHVVDPRSLLIPDQGSGLSSVQLDLPQALLKSVPHFELGDADDPMSSWIFGKRAEIFQYKFVGGHLQQCCLASANAAVGLPTTKIWHECSS